MDDNKLTRRKILQLSGGLVLGLCVPGANQERRGLTPSQVEGPYYPSNWVESDTDLTRVGNSKVGSVGKNLLVSGQVRDLSGQLLPGATVELWQACASGRYQHPSDPSLAHWDRNFQGYGKVVTGPTGEFRFRTIKPGAYPISRSWMRPPHIHFKVRCPGYRDLTTQMYFAGDKLNEEDGILNSLSLSQRKLVVVEFLEQQTLEEGFFEIVLSHEERPSSLVSPVLS